MTDSKVLTGPKHPLLSALRTKRNKLYLRTRDSGPLVGEILHYHREHGTSDQSIFQIYFDENEIPRGYKYKGPAEEARHLLSVGPEYIAVRCRSKYDPDDAKAVSRALHSGLETEVFRLSLQVDAARDASGMVAAVLATAVFRGTLVWDTDETMVQGSTRLCMDAIWQGFAIVNESGNRSSRRNSVFLGVLKMFNHEHQLVDDYARNYLDHRAEIATHLQNQGIEWGGKPLDSGAVADRIGISASTWRAYIARGQAPGPDLPDPARWHQATIDAYTVLHGRPGARW